MEAILVILVFSVFLWFVDCLVLLKSINLKNKQTTTTTNTNKRKETKQTEPEDTLERCSPRKSMRGAWLFGHKVLPCMPHYWVYEFKDAFGTLLSLSCYALLGWVLSGKQFETGTTQASLPCSSFPHSGLTSHQDHSACFMRPSICTWFFWLLIRS